MTAKSKATLKSDLTTLQSDMVLAMPDNNTREISPADVRDRFDGLYTVCEDIVDSYPTTGSSRIAMITGGGGGISVYYSVGLGVDTPLAAFPNPSVSSGGAIAGINELSFPTPGDAQAHLQLIGTYSNGSAAQFNLALDGVPLQAHSNIILGSNMSSFNAISSYIFPVLPASTLTAIGTHLSGAGTILNLFFARLWVKYEE